MVITVVAITDEILEHFPKHNGQFQKHNKECNLMQSMVLTQTMYEYQYSIIT